MFPALSLNQFLKPPVWDGDAVAEAAVAVGSGSSVEYPSVEALSCFAN